MLELEPVRFKVIRHVRPKLACASCDTIVQAPAPARPIERGMAGPGLLAHELVQQICRTISRSTGRQRSMHVKALTSIARYSRSGWAQPRDCSRR